MKYKVVFVSILLLAFVLRFWRLGTFPPGLTWDEAAIGYNAWGVLTVHRDEWLSRMPLTFRSFGDYKSPLAIYLVAASESLFGVNAFAVRLPVALAGVGLVVVSYFLMREILEIQEDRVNISLFVMLLVAVSPWALHFSVIAFESMLAAFFAAVGAFAFIRGSKKTPYMFLSAVAYALALYAYHSSKIVVPLTILILAFKYRRILRPNWKNLVLFLVTAFICALPLIFVSVFGKASDRFFGSSVIVNDQRQLKPLTQVVSLLTTHYLAHLDPRYLFLGFEQNFRQSNMRDGILSPLEGLLIGVAIILMIKKRSLRQFGFILLLIVISILPATLGNDVPHANRALLGLPWIQILAGLALPNFNKITAKYFLGVGFLLVVGLVWHISNDAHVYAGSRALSDMQYGYKEAVEYTRSQEPSVRKIYFSNHYGQAYIYLLFYKHLNPIDYRGGGLANYVITDHPFEDARGQSNVLIIGTPQEIPGTLGREKEFKYPDGKVAFRVVRQ